ncbi:c2h2 finger domain containing [Fusarium albosuccineum]|uniref:C2h2 finger domain containing n=1 Tax=Fusarium albosuccineum TaxID=1237068 RepID=A0A8H4P7G7_9HYPO|nr:c2h2 finger domain containing [Fusarium albosuccineum]
MIPEIAAMYLMLAQNVSYPALKGDRRRSMVGEFYRPPVGALHHQAAGSSTGSRDVNLEESDSDRDGDGGAGLLEEHEASADRECDLSKCHLCNEASSDVDSNVDHMRRAHSFVIPEKNRRVVEIETLLAYFHLRHTAEAAQQHMVGKSHFKFDLSEEEADGAKGAGPSKFGQLDGATLGLPSGKLLSRETRPYYRKPRTKSKATPQVQPNKATTSLKPAPDSNLDSTAKTLTRAQRREASFATRQLVCLRTKDRQSLIHLPMSQQLTMLAVQYAQIAKARRARRATQSRVETRGNKNLMKHFVNDVPGRLNG